MFALLLKCSFLGQNRTFQSCGNSSETLVGEKTVFGAPQMFLFMYHIDSRFDIESDRVKCVYVFALHVSLV